MQVFLDDFTVYGARHEHLRHLRICLERCRAARLNLNPAKCAFGVASGALLGDIVNREGIAVDRGNIKPIIEGPTLKIAKALSNFLGRSDGTSGCCAI